MRVAVVGGTGRIGRLVVDRLTVRNHVAVVLSRRDGVDLLTDDPTLADRLAGVEVVVDASSMPSSDAAEAERGYAEASRRLLAAGAAAGVRHHVVLSIACLDRVPGGPHYVGKRAQERAVQAGPIPWTIVRATQFHDFPVMVAERSLTDGVAEIAPMLLQPVAPHDVADVLVEVAEDVVPRGTMVLAGPAAEDAVDMARRAFAAQGGRWNFAPPGKETSAPSSPER